MPAGETRRATTVEDYHLLGLDPGAPPSAVKTAYRQLAKTCHPDLFLQSSVEERRRAEERFKALTEAYERILKSPLHHKPSPDYGKRAPGNGRREDVRDSSHEVKTSAGRRTKGVATSSSRPRRLLKICAGGVAVAVMLAMGFWSSRFYPGIESHRASHDLSSDVAPSQPTTPRTQQSPESDRWEQKIGRVFQRQRSLVESLKKPNQLPIPRVSKGGASQSFTLGSTSKEVLAVQGPPDRARGNVWVYGLSEVRFRDGRVVGYDNFDGSLKVKMMPQTSPTPGSPVPPFFTLGSTKDEVLMVQGTPTRVLGNRWVYGFSEVLFSNGRVVGYDNYFGNLRIRLQPSQPVKNRHAFTIGSTRDEVLVVQGTPTSIRGSVWFYRFSDVVFRDGRVRWVNDPTGLLRFSAPRDGELSAKAKP